MPITALLQDQGHASRYQLDMIRKNKLFTAFPADMLDLVLTDQELSPTAKVVWVKLFREANITTLELIKSRTSIAKSLNISVATLSRAMAQLIQRKYIVVAATYYAVTGNRRKQGYNKITIALSHEDASKIIKLSKDRKKKSVNDTTVMAAQPETSGCGQPSAAVVDKLANVFKFASSGGRKNAPQTTNSLKTSYQKPVAPVHIATITPSVPSTATTSTGDNHDVCCRRLISAYEPMAMRRLSAIGKSASESRELLDQFEFQLQKGFMAERETTHAIHVLVNLVRQGRYQTPYGYQSRVRL